MHEKGIQVRKRLSKVFDGSSVSPQDRYWALTAVGSNQQKVAILCKRTPALVSLVINDQGTSAPVAKTISTVTGIPLSKLWPCGKYSGEGRSDA